MTQINLNIDCIDIREGDAQPALEALRRKLSPRGDVTSDASRKRTIEVFGEPLTPIQVVEKICSDVQQEGMSSLLRYCEKLDGAELSADTLRVSADELTAAHRQADPDFLRTVRRIRENVAEFQSAILHQDVEVTRDVGVSLKQRYLPLRRIGICVPGGAAAYPSTVLMTAVPAQAAGVDQIAVVAPPTRFGAYNPDILATCHELGVSEVYRMGGAQAVAALAFGVTGIEPVDKIVGPGNLFVALAKKTVFGEVDIDSIAGPSEVVVLADGGAHPADIAADMLAQAEHAPGASILIAWDDNVLENSLVELNRQVAKLSRSELTVQSLENFGTLIRVRDEAEACRLTDFIAPEHLHIATVNADELCLKIRNAGATFLGYFTPVALGDYAAGPSHVLPTGGTARWASGLSANDFLRSGSVIHYTKNALHDIAEDVGRLADKEELTAHRASVDVRLR
ncbi:MAG: histidinol dehydrogenase [Planctomycetaceae bacterium]|nr:histidinol dehydrogenase [Planctomycetaceae bacterium]